MHHILKDFLLAIQGNTKPFSSFLKKWSALDDTLRTNHDSLPKDTVSAIHSSVSVIGIVSSDIIHLEKQTQQMDEAIAKDLSKLFDEKMTVDELQSPMRSTGASLFTLNRYCFHNHLLRKRRSFYSLIYQASLYLAPFKPS